MINQLFIKNILNNTNIIDIISNYITLKNKGHNYIAICPFHKEKKPSFTVNKIKQFYYCFGCKTHGNVINFLINFLNIKFLEAIKILSNDKKIFIFNNKIKKKIIIKKNNNKKKIKYKKKNIINIYNLMNITNNFYIKQLYKSKNALIYLKNRGITNKIIKKFNIGYANSKWNELYKKFLKLKSLNFLNSGLIVKNFKNNTYYDRFRERIIFPIKNIFGQIIAFGARTIVDNKIKYLNSSKTEIFHKKYELYGLYEAKKNIKKKNYVIVTEGYMDVITLYQFGFKNVVATLGSNFSHLHIKKILKLTKNIIFSFDGDKAGKFANNNAFKECLKIKTNKNIIKFIFFKKKNHDPDNYIRKYGKKKFKKKIKTAISFTKLLIKKIFNKNNIKNFIKIKLKIKKIMNIMPESIFKKNLFNFLIKILNDLKKKKIIS